MAKQLTDSEYQAFMQARSEYEESTLFSKPDTRAGFSTGFVRGLSYNQAKLTKLVRYIKGEIPYLEIYDLVIEIEGIIE